MISKLDHQAYAAMKLPTATRSEYDNYVKELFQYAVIIEKNQPYKKALINNSKSSKSNEEKKKVDMICGFKVNEEGMVSKKDFKEMSDEKRKEFLKKRSELKKNENI